MPRVKPAPHVASRMPDRPGRWRLIWKRQRQVLRQALAVTAVVGVLALGSLVVQAFGEGQSLRERLGDVTARLGFRIATIRIEGQEKTPDEMLRAALGVRPGDAILGFSVAAARARVESIAWVREASIERVLPATLVVRLTERRPFAVWQHDGKFVLVDKDGGPVTDSDVADFADELPLVVGVGAPKAAATLMAMLDEQPELRDRMVAAVRVGDRRWNLRMRNGADVLLPEGAEAVALTRLAELQASHQLLERPLAVIDLRLPDRLVVRPAADPAAKAADPAARAADPAARVAAKKPA
jgi:cell division protein FtsQ